MITLEVRVIFVILSGFEFSLVCAVQPANDRKTYHCFLYFTHYNNL